MDQLLLSNKGSVNSKPNKHSSFVQEYKIKIRIIDSSKNLKQQEQQTKFNNVQFNLGENVLYESHPEPITGTEKRNAWYCKEEYKKFTKADKALIRFVWGVNKNNPNNNSNNSSSC
jgi:hypothetical protein